MCCFECPERSERARETTAENRCSLQPPPTGFRDRDIPKKVFRTIPIKFCWSEFLRRYLNKSFIFLRWLIQLFYSEDHESNWNWYQDIFVQVWGREASLFEKFRASYHCVISLASTFCERLRPRLTGAFSLTSLREAEPQPDPYVPALIPLLRRSELHHHYTRHSFVMCRQSVYMRTG